MSETPPWHAEGTRRDRVRAATSAEIKSTARRLLVDAGTEAMTLRAIAREMGMTAPAIYRYFTSRDVLVAALADDLLGELLGELAGPAQDPDADPITLVADKARVFRRWAVRNRAEFSLTFALPRDDADCMTDWPNAQLFGNAFFHLFAEVWAERPFEVLPDERIDVRLADTLRGWADENGGAGMPLGALYVFLTMWVRLYGLVALEVFGHLSFAVQDVEPFFEMLLAEICGRLRDGRTP